MRQVQGQLEGRKSEAGSETWDMFYSAQLGCKRGWNLETTEHMLEDRV